MYSESILLAAVIGDAVHLGRYTGNGTGPSNPGQLCTRDASAISPSTATRHYPPLCWPHPWVVGYSGVCSSCLSQSSPPISSFDRTISKILVNKLSQNKSRNHLDSLPLFGLHTHAILRDNLGCAQATGIETATSTSTLLFMLSLSLYPGYCNY